MGNEIVNVKYPNRNALSIIFNINIYTNLNYYLYSCYINYLYYIMCYKIITPRWTFSSHPDGQNHHTVTFVIILSFKIKRLVIFQTNLTDKL